MLRPQRSNARLIAPIFAGVTVKGPGSLMIVAGYVTTQIREVAPTFGAAQEPVVIKL